jgi:hypothetical protein
MLKPKDFALILGVFMAGRRQTAIFSEQFEGLSFLRCFNG